ADRSAQAPQAPKPALKDVEPMKIDPIHDQHLLQAEKKATEAAVVPPAPMATLPESSHQKILDAAKAQAEAVKGMTEHAVPTAPPPPPGFVPPAPAHNLTPDQQKVLEEKRKQFTPTAESERKDILEEAATTHHAMGNAPKAPPTLAEQLEAKRAERAARTAAKPEAAAGVGQD
ncbi:MAG: hypothetical protein K2Y18_03515, partial [Alphaproteobacteria bacterium]|nr:hypothetical protein [Alphaproteobacteria bacterium]